MSIFGETAMTYSYIKTRIEPRIETRIEQRLSPKRWQHTQRCMTYARQLAPRYHLDADKAALAALLHDSCRSMTEEEMLIEAERQGICVGEIERQQPILLHGPLAARWAAQELQIDDPDVLEAIHWHTTGAVDIGALATLIYIVDSIEPGRKHPQAEMLRRSAEQLSLTHLALEVVDQSLCYQLDKREPIAPQTVLWRNQLLKRIEKEADDDE